MALPTNRYDFKDYCLRKLGAPVIQINLDDAQIEDCVDYALRKFMDYHFDGVDHVYYKHVITSADRAKKSITLPENVMGAVNLFPIGLGSQVGNMFSLEYQIALNEMYTFTANSMLPYFMTQFQMQSLEQMLTGIKPIRYNRFKNELKIDMNWNSVVDGQFLVVEAYEIVDPEEYPRLWQEPWLIDYTCAQIGLRWGKVLTRYSGMTLPGGVQFDGNRILTDAQIEITKLEEDLKNISMPPMDFIG
jgi:hypothetical protein